MVKAERRQNNREGETQDQRWRERGPKKKTKRASGHRDRGTEVAKQRQRQMWEENRPRPAGALAQGPGLVAPTARCGPHGRLWRRKPAELHRRLRGRQTRERQRQIS